MLTPDKIRNINHLCDVIIEKQGHDELYLAFSRGKDSIASFLALYETGKFSKIHLFHYHLVPNLSFVDEYLEYFEDKFGVEIVNVPVGVFMELQQSAVLKSPLQVEATHRISLESREPLFRSYDITELTNMVRMLLGLPDSTYCAIGVTQNDSAMRRMIIKKHGVITEHIKKNPIKSVRKWYPIWDFRQQDIKRIIKKHGVKYPDDYDLFGLSFDGLDYRFLKPIQLYRPKDYQKIKEYFPMIDLMIEKHEHYFGKSIRRSKFNHLKV